MSNMNDKIDAAGKAMGTAIEEEANKTVSAPLKWVFAGAVVLLVLAGLVARFA